MLRSSRWLGPALAFVATLGLSNLASAQTFHEAGKISVAIERAFGINYSNADFEAPAVGDRSATAFGFGFQPGLSPLHWTRFGIDAFLNERLSVGGSVGFFKVSGDLDTTGLLLAPRVGYAIPLGEVITFWPRGGFTFVKPGDASLLALSVEGMFVFSPNRSWGVLVGPTLDFGITGKAGGKDWSELAIGLPTLGMIGSF